MRNNTRSRDRFLSSVWGETPLWRRPGKRKKNSKKPVLNIESLEDRLALSSNCGCDAILMPLVPDSAMTNIAVKSGNWTDASTWANGKVPLAGANVLIAQGVDVTVNQVISPALHTIRIDGELDFAPHANTGLNVDTMVVNDSGVLQIGTANNPIDANHTAIITFTDSGPINTQWDPNLISRGLLSMGTVTMYGSAKTAYDTLAVDPSAGAITLTLSQVPTGWQVGDQLVVTATAAFNASMVNNNQNDVVTIQSIHGNQVTLTSPLKFNHIPPESGLNVYVADLTRNVMLQSQNPSDISGRGHVMFMMDTVNLNYVCFDNLGRTDKLNPVNDPQLNAQGQLIPGTGTNPRGRYAVHFHEVGTDPMMAPAYVNGCVVDGSPGWGYVNHDSYVNFVNDVAYNVSGAAFVTESGSEIGSFQNDLAIHDIGTGETNGAEQARSNIQDFGHGGVGFWLEGMGVAVNNCIAVDASEAGFYLYDKGLIQNGVTTQFLAVNLPNPSWAKGQTTVDVRSVPLASFQGDIAYDCSYGLDVEYNLVNPLVPGEQSVFSNFTAWNNVQGARFLYGGHFTLQNSWIVGTPNSVGVDEGNEGLTDTNFVNLRVEGCYIGLRLSEQGMHTVSGGYYNNVRNIAIPPALNAGHTITMNTIQFGTPSQSLLQGRPQYNIYLYALSTDYQSFSPNLFNPSIVTLNGQQLYSPEQAANYVPFAAGGPLSGVPPQLVGLTNQQIWNKFGLALGGVIAPATASSLAGSWAFIGAVQVSSVSPPPGGGGGGGGGGSTGGGSGGGGFVPPPLNVPPLLALFDSFLGGVESVNYATQTETIVDSLFGFPLLVATFNSLGNLVSVTMFGFNVTSFFA